MGAVPLELMGKGIGEWVVIRSGDNEQSYLVTGIVQNIARGFDPYGYDEYRSHP